MSKMMVVGEKENFVLRSLIKKVRDAGIGCDFVPWTIKDINAKWADASVLTIFMDDGIRIPKDILHFLIDKLTDDDKQMILVGAKTDIQYLYDQIPGNLIYNSYPRPMDNDKYIADVSELFAKLAAGEFRKSILIVDDDPNYLSMVRGWLKESYKIYMANSGLQAIKMLGKHKADLILLDYEMPVTSGPQVLEMLRNDEETAKIPVMFLTGKGDKESVMSVLALKPEGYFLKTIEQKELLENLGDYFLRHK